MECNSKVFRIQQKLTSRLQLPSKPAVGGQFIRHMVIVWQIHSPKQYPSPKFLEIIFDEILRLNTNPHMTQYSHRLLTPYRVDIANFNNLANRNFFCNTSSASGLKDLYGAVENN